MISLALGRTPTFNAWQNVSPGPIGERLLGIANFSVDDTEDDDDWMPVFWDPALGLEMQDYPPQKALTTLNNRYQIKVNPTVGEGVLTASYLRSYRKLSCAFTTVARRLTRACNSLAPCGVRYSSGLKTYHPPSSWKRRSSRTIVHRLTSSPPSESVAVQELITAVSTGRRGFYSTVSSFLMISRSRSMCPLKCHQRPQESARRWQMNCTSSSLSIISRSSCETWHTQSGGAW